MYWIMKKRDDAILGMVRGIQSAEAIDGPIDSFSEAVQSKAKYRAHGSCYYSIVENECKPESYTREYEFLDAQDEFDDV
jgi:hypothetical protein